MNRAEAESKIQNIFYKFFKGQVTEDELHKGVWDVIQEIEIK